MREGYWMIRTVRSGKVIEKSQFFVSERKPRAPKRKGGTSAAAKDKNLNTAARQLARTINCNWSAGDLWVTLTYDPAKQPTRIEDADRACALFWRRLGRALAEQGIKVKGFWLTADKDGKTGAPEPLHHHMVISAEGVDVRWSEDAVSCTVGGRELADIWGNGTIDVEELREQEDYTPVAIYCVRQAVNGENVKKWHPSKGLKKPVVESERVVQYSRELRAPAGATVSEIGHYDDVTGNHYIRYIRRPRTKKDKIGGHKELLFDPNETDEMRWSLE